MMMNSHKKPAKRRSRNAEYVNVAIRLRGGVEDRDATPAVIIKDRSCCARPDKKQVKTVTVDHCFGDETSQQELYNTLGKRLVENVWSGTNTSLLAYGQTGSGKTYSIFGPPELPACELYKINTFHPEAGLVPRLFDDLFRRVSLCSAECVLEVSLLEVYLERVFDLLHNREQKLLRGTNESGFFAEGLTKRRVNTLNDVIATLREGYSHMSIANTAQNSVSSRAHTLIEISVRNLNSNKTSKITVVDLAGSEDVKRTDAQGELLLQATNINSSLLELGMVIEKIVEGGNQQPHESHQVSYRGSSLTKLLKNSLSQKTKSTLLVTISPRSCDISQTLSSLRFADRAKHLRNPDNASGFFGDKKIESPRAGKEDDDDYLLHDSYQKLLDQRYRYLSEIQQQRERHKQLSDQLEQFDNTLTGDIINVSHEVRYFNLLNKQSVCDSRIALLQNKMNRISEIIAKHNEPEQPQQPQQDTLSLELEVKTRGVELLEAKTQILKLQQEIESKNRTIESLMSTPLPTGEGATLASALNAERIRAQSLLKSERDYSNVQVTELSAEIARVKDLLFKSNVDFEKKLKNNSDLTSKYRAAMETGECENAILKKQIRDLQNEVFELKVVNNDFEDRYKRHCEEKQSWGRKYSAMASHMAVLRSSGTSFTAGSNGLTQSIDPFSDIDDISSISPATTPGGSVTPPPSSPLAATVPQAVTPQSPSSRLRWAARRKDVMGF